MLNPKKGAIERRARTRLSALAVACITLTAMPAVAQRGAALPAYLTLPAEVALPPSPEARVVRESWGEAEFPKEAGGVLRGEHWNMALRYPTAAVGVPNPKGKDVFGKLAPPLQQGGWSIVRQYDQNPFGALLRYQKDGRDAWLHLEIFSPTDIRGDLVAVGPQPLGFAVKVPAAVPVRVDAAKGDFAELPPLPGSRMRGGKRIDQPLRIDLRSADGKHETTTVASSSTVKSYTLADLSNVQFTMAYAGALKAAGWTIVDQRQGVHQGDATLTAHYGGNGRDLWAAMRSSGGDYDLQLGENDADELARQFAKDCHVPLNGVLFDFDQATLRPESDGILEHALGLIRKPATAQIEVQGHTDNVGTDEYNNKLSAARAATVAAWFTAHGVASSRLSAKGYGKSHPVADNGTAEGRAANRRVEIARVNCGS